MVSQISVCNSALVKVGADRISSIDESHKRAIILKALYCQKRDATLRAHPWKFATKRVKLLPNATIPAWGYKFQYDEPNDFLSLVDFRNPDMRFMTEAGQILCDEPHIEMRYIFRQTDESTWDACFAEAFAWSLAAEIAYAMTQSITLAQNCEAKYKAVLAEARWSDGLQRSSPELDADLWSLSRRAGWGRRW